MQYFNERLPCPKCGEKNETRMRARFIPKEESPFTDTDDIVQARCFVDCGCGCAFDRCKEYKVFGVSDDTTEEQIEDIMRRICRAYYEEKRKEQHEDSKF